MGSAGSRRVGDADDGRVSRTEMKATAGFRAELPGLDLATLVQLTCAKRERLVVRVSSYEGEGFIFSAGGRIPPSGPSLSAVFTVAYAGFLVGPPVIGFLSDRIGLTGALGCLAILSGIVALGVRRAPGVEGASVQDVFADPVASSVTEVAG